MIEFLYSLPSRSFFITLGMIVSLTVMMALLLWEYKFSLRFIVTSAISAAVTATSGIGGQLARKLTYGGWLDPIKFINGLFEYEGTHYIGAALYIMLIAPLLWLLVMRKEEGTFSRSGAGRYMSILSVYSILQAFIGRIGCLRSGCCYGRAYYGFLRVPCIGLDYPTYPAVYTELLITFLTIAVIVPLHLKKKNTAHIFCIGYGLSVFISEFMYDRAGTVTLFGLTAIQICALALMILGLVFLRYGRKSAGCGKSRK